MKKALKGALLSGFIFPGLGQLWLKRYLLGLALLLAVCVTMAVVVGKVAQQALSLVEKAEAEGGTVDLVAIVNQAGALSSAPSDATTRAAMMLLVFCWIVGVVDAYLAGRRADRGGDHR